MSYRTLTRSPIVIALLMLAFSIMSYFNRTIVSFATPRIVCDVPFVGKRWVHQIASYDRELGISRWTKNYRTGIELDDPDALTRLYEYYDPIYLLPESGQEWWRAFQRELSGSPR